MRLLLTACNFKHFKTNIMKKRTIEQINNETKKNGFISKKDLQLIKNRSNKAQEDLFDYEFMENNFDMGIPVSEEQGEQGLAWLKKFIKKDGTSAVRGGTSVHGFRELEIIKNASPEDFTFRGFYNNGNAFFNNFIPIYELNGMKYVVQFGKPHIIR